MYNIPELESKFKCFYPDSVSAMTQEKRLTDITALQNMIQTAKDEDDLTYGATEERLLLHTTQAGEKVYIQYPGKETTKVGDKRRPYDFRPRIMTAAGTMIIDMVFADMWGVVEKINEQQHQILKLLACLFFHMGRMTLHQRIRQEYPSETVDSADEVIDTSTRELDWYTLVFEDEVLESLNFLIQPISIRGGVNISFEAFLYFFEYILQNEDSKYYDKKCDLSSGRIPTSDSMLLLSSHLFGKTSLSVVLQRFVSGYGIAKCNINEIDPATDGLVNIVNRKKDLASYFDEHEIQYRKDSIITVNGQTISVAVKTPSPKIAVLSKDSEEKRNRLSEKGWRVYCLEGLIPETAYRDFLSNYEVDE